MDSLRKRIAELVVSYFGARGVTRSRLELFLRQLESLLPQETEEGLFLKREFLRLLNATTVLLERREDGEPVYLLREGKLAGGVTTEHVRGKSPREVFPPEVNAITMPMVERAFSGEQVQFTYPLNGKIYLALLYPYRCNASGAVVQVLGSITDVTDAHRMAAELEHHNRLFQALLNEMPCGILYEEFTADGERVQVIINREFTNVTGYTLEEFLKLADNEFRQRVHPEDHPHVEAHYTEWAQKGSSTPLHLQYRFFDRYGVERWLDNYIVRILHANGNTGILQVVLDITERALGERRLRHAASYLEQSIEPLIECDSHWTITLLNRAAREAFPELAVGQSLYSHRLGEDVLTATAEALAQTVVTLGSRSLMRHIVQTEQGWRIFCHDVTTLVEAEQILSRALEHEQAMNLLRSQFVSTLSHEFRTPMAGILTAAQLLERYAPVMTEEQRKETVASIVARVRDLEHIVQSFTRRTILLGRMHPVVTSTQIGALLSRLVEEMEIVKRRKATVTIAMEPQNAEVLVDAELLREVVEALMDNAVRYSAEECHITVTAELHPERVRLCVRDYGVGIPEEEMERLFTPYFRSSRTGNVPGSGLSLATLKPLVEAAGGMLSLVNRVDGGMLATLELPYQLSPSGVIPIPSNTHEHQPHNFAH